MQKITSPSVLRFPDSRTAYNESQTGGADFGDVLACDDGVVGILVGAWPTAVTTEAGSFHRVNSDWNWSEVPEFDGSTTDYSSSLSLAVAVAVELVNR